MLPSKAVPYATLKSSTFRAYPLARRYWPDRSFFTCDVRYGGVGGECEAGPCAGSSVTVKTDTIITITVKNSSQKIIVSIVVC